MLLLSERADMIHFGLVASGESGDGGATCQHGWFLRSLACKITNTGCAPGPPAGTGTQRGGQELWILRYIVCPVSCTRLCVWLMLLRLLPFQKTDEEKYLKYFWGIITSIHRTWMSENAQLLSTQLPKNTHTHTNQTQTVTLQG